MTYTIYKNGEYVNRIVADENFVKQMFPSSEGYTYELSPEVDPDPDPEEPTEEDDVNSMLVDHEYRLTLLEIGV